ncbi:hypothetical protein [Nocardiopsis coralliicola]
MDAAAYVDHVALRLQQAETEAETHHGRLSEFDRAHRVLEERVEHLESELAEAKRARLEAFARWFNCREDRDRARFVARRLRRRLDRRRKKG